VKNPRLQRNKILRCIPAEDELESIYEIQEGCNFSQETINGFVDLGEILQKIHDRLIGEGCSIIDGKLISPSGEILYERK